MKIHYLLLTLTASVLGIAAIEPWVRNSLPTQFTQSVRVADDSPRQVNPQTAQAVANKVTGAGFGSGGLSGKTVDSSGNMAELDRKAQPPTAKIEDSQGDDKKAKTLAYMNSGGEKYALKDYKGAIADFDRVIAIDPRHPAAYHSRGDAKAALGYATSKSGKYGGEIPDYKSAVADFDRAIAIDPQNVLAYFSRARTKSKLGVKQDLSTRCKNQNVCVLRDAGVADYRSVITLYDRVLAADRQNIAAYLGRGDAKSALNSHKNAIADYDRAISLQERSANVVDPRQNILAYLHRGAAKSSLGEEKGFKDAVADYDRVIAIDPQNVEAYLHRGRAKSALGSHKDAVADYDRVIAIDPQNVEAYLHRGNIKSFLWHEQDAIADYDRAIAIDPQNVEAYLDRGGTKAGLGDYEGAIADYDRSATIQHRPKYAREEHKSKLKQYRSTIAECDRKISRQERSANASNPQDDRAYFDRGNAKARLGDYKGAIADYDRAIAIDPRNAWAYFGRGETKRDLGDRQGAIADMKAVVQLYKGSDDKLLLPVAKSLVQQESD